MYMENSIKKYIDDIASDSPTPGGGSVAALIGAVGGALANMVGFLTVEKKVFKEYSEDIKNEFIKNQEKIALIRKDLEVIVDEDTKAFDKVMEAFKLPKETEEDKKYRSDMLQDGYRIAIDVPKRCADKCLEALRLQRIFSEYGNVHAITDVGVAVLSLYAGVEGALMNVSINLASIKDEEYRNNLAKEVEAILAEAAKIRDEELAIVYKRLGK